MASATEAVKAPEAAPLIATVAPTPLPPTEVPAAAPITDEPAQPTPTATPEEVNLFRLDRSANATASRCPGAYRPIRQHCSQFAQRSGS
ncbi:MAG: hypothetical protein IPK16_33830 [Anaerolineales bacterium]|nr:hypothetical protein [Anaerolineales bacterium]